MKRNGYVTLCALVLLALTLLAGCGLPAPADSGEDGPSGSTGFLDEKKAMYLAKQDMDGNVLFTLGKEEAEAFFLAYFDGSDSLEGELFVNTDGLTPACQYVITQDQTILAGQTEPQSAEEILRFTLYEDSDAVTMQVSASAVSGMDADWLDGLLQFSYQGDAEDTAYLRSCTQEDVADAA